MASSTQGLTVPGWTLCKPRYFLLQHLHKLPMEDDGPSTGIADSERSFIKEHLNRDDCLTTLTKFSFFNELNMKFRLKIF